MEAKIEKKPLEGTFKKWNLRLWRIKERRLIYYKAECTEWNQCIQSKIKLDIDLAHLASASFYPQNNPKPNLLLIKHPKIGEKEGIGGGLLLRFNDKETDQQTMLSWLKVLTSWSVDKKKNRIYVSIPSNFSFSIWSVLGALYAHPDLLKTEGIFRKETTEARVKHRLVNDLLYEKISIQELKTVHNDVYLLSGALKYLFTMLPSSLFGDHNYEDLVKAAKGMNIDIMDEKQMSDSRAMIDDDMEQIPKDTLRKLKTTVDSMYFGTKYKYRYGLIGLTLHLLKQVSMNVKTTRMSCHALAKLFAMCFESKQWLHSSRLSNPTSIYRSIPLMKVLIYHSYFFFPLKQWRMDEVVVGEVLEAKTMEMYHELKLTKKQKKNRLKKMGKVPPTKYFNAKSIINNIPSFTIPKVDIQHESKENDAGNSRAKGRGLLRYTSVDDMDLGSYTKRAYNTEITTKKDSKFEPIHVKNKHGARHRQILSRSLSRDAEVIVPPPPPLDDDTKAVSVMKAKLRKASQVETPKISPNKEWNTIHQSKITSFGEPCHYHDGLNECIYFICNANELDEEEDDTKTSHRQCWMYNMKLNQYQSFTQYPNYLQLHNFSVSMDPNDHRIFIVSGNTEFVELKNVEYDDKDREYLWGAYNVETYCDNKYNKRKQKTHNLRAMGDDVASIFITSDICELHVVGGKLSNIHYKWDEYQQKMVDLYSFDAFSGIQGHRLVFVHNEWNRGMHNRLLLLGGLLIQSFEYTDQIWCCDMKDNDNVQWNVMKGLYSSYTPSQNKNKPIKLPRALAHFGCVVYQNLFVIIFGGRTDKDEKIDDIYYLNLHTMQWTCAPIKCPAKARGYYAIMSKKQEEIHLFQKDSNQHYRIKVNDIVSLKECEAMEKEQEAQYKMLKQSENQMSASFIERQDNIDAVAPHQYYRSCSSSATSTSSSDDKRNKKETIAIAAPAKKKKKKALDYEVPPPPPPSSRVMPFKKRTESNKKEEEAVIKAEVYPSLARESLEKATPDLPKPVEPKQYETTHVQMVTSTAQGLPKTSIAKVRSREDVTEERAKGKESERKDDYKEDDKVSKVSDADIDKHINDVQLMNSNSNNGYNHVADGYDEETAVDSGGFSCNVLYGWFAGLCGLGATQATQTNTNDYRVLNDGYDDGYADDGYAYDDQYYDGDYNDQPY
eukprot:1044158_1